MTENNFKAIILDIGFEKLELQFFLSSSRVPLIFSSDSGSVHILIYDGHQSRW